MEIKTTEAFAKIKEIVTKEVETLVKYQSNEQGSIFNSPNFEENKAMCERLATLFSLAAEMERSNISAQVDTMVKGYQDQIKRLQEMNAKLTEEINKNVSDN